MIKRLVVALLLLTACESDEEKLTRLREDQAIACLNTKLETVDSLRFTANIKCQLAERALNKFMEGR